MFFVPYCRIRKHKSSKEYEVVNLLNASGSTYTVIGIQPSGHQAAVAATFSTV